MSDEDLAMEAARRASEALLRLHEDSALAGVALGAEGDRAANAAVMDLLRRERPADGFLSEEEVASAARLGRSRVWIVDPLDGTREFAERRDDWAVHVGLSIDGAPALGVVVLPARGRVFCSAAVAAPKIVPPARPRIVVSRTRPPAIAREVAQALGADLVPMGSAGAKAMAVVQGEAEIYLHAGGQSEWDNCAPVAIALAAGLHATRLDGAPLRYNREPPLVPDLLICRPAFAPSILRLCAAP